MIIDSHAHIGNMVVLNLSVGKVLRSMERYGVDFSLVSSIESTEYYKPHKRLPFFLRRSTLRVCKKTVRAVRRHPDKLGALLWIQTGRKIPVERLSRFIEKNRRYIYGIKIHPYRSEVAPDDPRMEPVYELAKRFGLPVAAHTGDMACAQTALLFNAAKAHPDVKFIAVHMDLESGNKEAIDLIAQLPKTSTATPPGCRSGARFTPCKPAAAKRSSLAPTTRSTARPIWSSTAPVSARSVRSIFTSFGIW